MADSVRVGYFLEDSGHEEFILGLIEHIIDDLHFNIRQVISDVRNATGGKGRVLGELKRFLSDVKNEKQASFDILVIAIDGNCKGYTEKRNELQQIIEQSGYLFDVVYAIPDPHIEYWYMADPTCFSKATGVSGSPNPPAYKCEKNRYKIALANAFREGGVRPPLGGIEYGKLLALEMNLFAAGEHCSTLKTFIGDLKSCLKTHLS